MARRFILYAESDTEDTNMKEFQFGIPQKVIFGKGSIQKLPEVLTALNAKRVLIISGPTLKRMNLVAKTEAIARLASVATADFCNVPANPSVEVVDQALVAYRTFGADSIIALGGGSPMDTAKALSVVGKYGGSALDYESPGSVPGDTLPVIAIPTTAGTGSEVTSFSVITDKKRNYKFSIFSETTLPNYAILDSNYILSLPASVAAATGMDALTHAIEAYLSLASTPFSDAMAEKGMELLGRYILAFVANRSNEEAADGMLAGSMFAGIAFGKAKLGNIHAMSHPVSGYFDVPHGVANAILLPAVLRFNALADVGRYETIYQYIKRPGENQGRFTPSMLVDEIYQLLKEVEIPRHLAQVGVKKEMISSLTKDALTSGNIKTNPRSSTFEDIERIYYEAY